MRQMALIEELVERGCAVTLVGDLEVAWAARQASDYPIRLLPGMPDAEFIAWCVAEGIDVVMIDGYEFSADLGSGLRAVGVSVAAMVDGEFGAHQVAEVYVDQNLGSSSPDAPGRWLVGPEFVLLRDVVRSRRGQPTPSRDVPRILVVFGGTDAFAGAPVLTDLLLQTGEPVHAVAIAATPDLADALHALPVPDGCSVEVLPPQADLPGLALTCDGAISAAGSSTWEFACLGIPTALVCVVDNQRLGYEAATAELCLGVGHLEELRSDEAAITDAVATLRRFVADRELRRRLAETGTRIVDGDGRVRVADALEELAQH